MEVNLTFMKLPTSCTVIKVSDFVTASVMDYG